MTIRELGYRRWPGTLKTGCFRWYLIASSGIRLMWRNMWLRRLLVLAWFPAVYLGVGFFLYEQSTSNSPDAKRALVFALQAYEVAGPLISEFKQETDVSRHNVWAILLLIFLRYLQGGLMVLVVGMIAPSLITQDLRTRAYLLYFSHPLTSWEYLLGKASVVFGYLAMINLLPGTVLYILGVMLSPDLSVIRDTWDLPFRVMAASIVMMIPTTAIAVMFSSLTVERRYAGFGWFSLWIVGWVANRTLTVTETPGTWWWVSLNHTIGKAQSWVFGQDDFSSVAPAFILLTAYTLFALTLARARILSPLRS